VDSTSIIVIVVFGILMLAGLAAAMRQGVETRARVRRFAALRGWTVSPTSDPHLAALLTAAFTDQTWYASNVVQVQPPPESVYLFAYDYYRKERPSKRWQGFACLVEGVRAAYETPVEIFTRTPGLDLMESDRIQAGGEEFRSKFTITGKRPEAAPAAVNVEVEQLLLEHAAGPGWYLTVTVAGNSILVASAWAKKQDEWDALITLARKLHRAIR
jgi:hypothetical protein